LLEVSVVGSPDDGMGASHNQQIYAWTKVRKNSGRVLCSLWQTAIEKSWLRFALYLMVAEPTAGT
jgi:hypothetical protein